MTTHDDVPEHYKTPLHQIETSGGDENRRTAREAEIRILLTREQIASAEKIAEAADKHAKALKGATIVLAVATAVLAAATIALVIVTAS